MKKKIITLCLVIAMLSVAVIGGTLAYFTDVDQATNEFTVGKLDIDLYEEVDHKDGAGNDKDGKAENEVLGKGDEVKVEHSYTAVMPGDVLTKKVTVVNEETEAVYMALSIVQNNYGTGKMTAEDNWYNQRIDNYYEKAPFGESGTGYSVDEMQSLTSRTFTGTGWGTLAYGKTSTGAAGGVNPVSNMRYYPTTIAGVDQDGSESFVGRTAPQIIAIDYAVANQGEHSDNMMKNGTDGKNVYDELAAGCRVWVYYLYLPAKTSMDFDLTITVPTEIDEYSIEAFQNMNLDVRASAIQVSGFKTAYDAFVALEEVYPFDYAVAHDPRA